VGHGEEFKNEGGFILEALNIASLLEELKSA
jgi:hypothetical protein